MASTCYFRRLDHYDPKAIRHAMEEGWSTSVGKEDLFQSGQRVLLKPNLLSGAATERAVTTHPAMLEAVATFFLDRGCHVSVGDSPALDSLPSVLRRTGLAPIVEKLKLGVTPLSRGVDRPSRNRFRFPLLHLAEELGEFDHIVNLPKLKTHSMMTLTLAVKNLFGCVPGKRKAAYHLSAGEEKETFARLLLEIHDLVAPSLHVLDGIVAMEGNGPGSGDPRPLGLLAMSRDALALDASVAALLGVPWESVPILAAARAAGIEPADPSRVTLVGDPPGSWDVRDFRLPRSVDCRWRIPPRMARLFNNAFTPRPFIDSSRCVLCRRCEGICAAGAIGETADARLAVLPNRCIRCFCCHEVCPVDAVEIVRGRGLRLLDTLTRRRT